MALLGLIFDDYGEHFQLLKKSKDLVLATLVSGGRFWKISEVLEVVFEYNTNIELVIGAMMVFGVDFYVNWWLEL